MMKALQTHSRMTCTKTPITGHLYIQLSLQTPQRNQPKFELLKGYTNITRVAEFRNQLNYLGNGKSAQISFVCWRDIKGISNQIKSIKKQFRQDDATFAADPQTRIDQLISEVFNRREERNSENRGNLGIGEST